MMRRDEWQIAEVAAMPWPFDLFNCDWRERAGSVEGLDLGGCQAAMRSMVESLSPDEVSACSYHRPDWPLAADTAVALVERTGDLADDDLATAARSMDSETAWALYSFVGQPIIWNGGQRLGNGQHRVCAMKLQGVERCPVVEY
jgi:hypothetical protein